jgi:integrase
MYDGVWTRYIEPELGRTSINRITALMIDEVISDLDKRGVGQATITKGLTQLSAMFRVAMKYRLIPSNPMLDIDRPTPKPSRIVRPLTPTQIEGIRAQIKRPKGALLVSLLAYSGIRPGEALALRWNSIHDDTLRVETAISLGEERSTKTGEPRDVKLLAPLKHELLEHRMSIGRPSESALIFPAKDGGHWDSSDWRNFRQRIFAPAVEAIGLPKETRPYDLRHSAASLFIAAGKNPSTSRARWGTSPRCSSIDTRTSSRTTPSRSSIRRPRSWPFETAALRSPHERGPIDPLTLLPEDGSHERARRNA